VFVKETKDVGSETAVKTEMVEESKTGYKTRRVEK